MIGPGQGPCDLAAISALASSIDGWLSDRQGRALYAAAASAGSGEIVEIGSWKGRSTVWLAAGASVARRRVYAIDPHIGSREDPDARTLQEFQANIDRAGFAGVVEPLVMTAAAAAERVDRRIALLFIDGDHTYAGVKRDADLWLPKMEEGGIVLFHDVASSGYSGPRRVFQTHVCRNAGFHRVRRVGSMAIAVCSGRRRSAAHAVRGRVFGLLLYRYDIERMFKNVARRLRRYARREPVHPLAS